MTKTEERKLLHVVERHRFQDELRHKATRQGRFDAAMWHLEHPIPGTDRCLEPSDGGVGAAHLRDDVTRRMDCGRSDLLWHRLWRNRVAALPPKGRAVLRALMRDWRTAPAARAAGVSRNCVERWKIKFKTHFALCWQAYRHTFAK